LRLARILRVTAITPFFGAASHVRDPHHADDVRLDKWLWAARFFKTRSLASQAIDGGKVDVNGERARRARPVRADDRITIRKPPFEHVVIVRALSDVRGSGAVAATLYEETAESRAARDKLAASLRAMGPPAFREQGRPSKQERRHINRWRGRDT
jgi:ribosome-associated heat shock protein Hsp15